VITTLAIRDNAGDVTYPAGIPGVIAAAMEPLPAPLRPPEGAAETLARNASVLVARALALSARDHPKGGYDISAGFGIINPYGALTEAAKLARARAVQPAGEAGIELPARFGPAPPAISAVHRSATRVAAFGAVTAAGVIALAAALILALRRPLAPLPNRVLLQKLAEREQVPHAGMNLDPAGDPHPGDVSRGGGQRDHIVAVRGQPDVGRRVVWLGLGYRCGPVIGEPGHERHA
jgi:hypothetical protein